MAANDTPPLKNPSDIAREAFKQLAIRKIAPTPDAYLELYNEVAGVSPKSPPPDVYIPKEPNDTEKILISFARSIQFSKTEYAHFGHKLNRSAQAESWDEYGKLLTQFFEAISTKPSLSSPGVSLVDDSNGVSAATSSSNTQNALSQSDGRQKLFTDLLYRTYTLALATLLRSNPPLCAETEGIAQAVKVANSDAEFNQISSRIKQLCFQIELQSGDSAELQELLLRLFDLLLTNIRDLLDNDNWLKGQIEVIQNLIAGPIDQKSVVDATRSLKDVIYKQGILKSSLAESRSSVKNMMSAFLDRLNAMAESTGNYQNHISQYSQALSSAKNLDEATSVIGKIISETNSVYSETLRSRDIIIAAQKEVNEAESRIKELEAKLEQMSELVLEDQLTGSLNRRGMEDVFEREAGRADRRQTPLCVALIDLDNFKKLNDTHGHAAGDEALVHVVRIVKQTLRTVDCISRYGGEEFVIIMPETSMEDAAQAMMRVQRELTKHFFIANEQRLFITFSCGVALRKHGEAQDSLLKRADKAMYEAKQTGKNKVVCAS